jgi:hypothetical protein
VDLIYILVGCIFVSFSFLLVLENGLDAVAAALVRLRKALTEITTAG